MNKQKISWKLKNEFPASIRYSKHDGSEINLVLNEQTNEIDIQNIITRLKQLNIKMYCIKEYATDKILADERGMKCSKSLEKG